MKKLFYILAALFTIWLFAQQCDANAETILDRWEREITLMTVAQDNTKAILGLTGEYDIPNLQMITQERMRMLAQTKEGSRTLGYYIPNNDTIYLLPPTEYKTPCRMVQVVAHEMTHHLQHLILTKQLGRGLTRPQTGGFQQMIEWQAYAVGFIAEEQCKNE